MATKLCDPEMFETLLEKAAGLLMSEHGRGIKSIPYGGDFGGADPLHFGIANGSALSSRHVQAMVFYTDFTELCTLFGQSLRKMSLEEELKEMTARNAKFFHISKALRELVSSFGSNGMERKGAINSRVTGPFFTGVSVVLNVSEFSIGFNTPTSTSKSWEIAWRFAGTDGMVMTVDNQKAGSSWQPLYNATWISNFVEEDEYFWFGFTDKLSVDDITMVETTRSYAQSMSVLYMFDAVLSGLALGQIRSTKKQLAILKSCLEYIRSGSIQMKHRAVDDYVLDNVYSFCQRKTKIYLMPQYLNLDDPLYKFVCDIQNAPYLMKYHCVIYVG